MNLSQPRVAFRRFNCNGPAQADQLAEAEAKLATTLPPDYRAFLLQSNGGEGLIGNLGYAVLWRVEELFPFNREYEANVYAPGLILFGSNGGGEAFAFDYRQGAPRIVIVPFIGMSEADASPLADNFEDWLAASPEDA
jgi:hypothetical protein